MNKEKWCKSVTLSTGREDLARFAKYAKIEGRMSVGKFIENAVITYIEEHGTDNPVSFAYRPRSPQNPTVSHGLSMRTQEKVRIKECAQKNKRTRSEYTTLAAHVYIDEKYGVDLEVK